MRTPIKITNDFYSLTLHLVDRSCSQTCGDLSKLETAEERGTMSKLCAYLLADVANCLLDILAGQMPDM